MNNFKNYILEHCRTFSQNQFLVTLLKGGIFSHCTCIFLGRLFIVGENGGAPYSL